MADEFIKAIARGEVAGFSIDPQNPMLTFTNADIYSPTGTKVRYTGHNGMDHDKRHADKFLTVDTIYTLERADVGGWHTDFYLVEVPGECFNSVHFAEVP